MGLLDKLFGASQSAPEASVASNAPEQARRIYEDGVRLFEAGQKREGLLRLTEAISVDPKCVVAHLALASAFYAINPTKYADQILYSTEAVLAVDPGQAKALNIAAATHFALGKHAWDAESWEQAAASFEKSYDFDAEAEHTPEALAFCAEQAGALASAASAFERRLATSADDFRARYLAGRTYIKLAMNSDRPGGAISQGEALRRGEAHLKAVLVSSPTHAGANYWLGGAYLMAGRDEEVQKIIDLLRSVDPERCAELEELRS